MWRQRISKHYQKKTLGTSVIYSPWSPSSLQVNTSTHKNTLTKTEWLFFLKKLLFYEDIMGLFVLLFTVLFLKFCRLIVAVLLIDIIIHVIGDYINHRNARDVTKNRQKHLYSFG